jgi:hypothetical protein
MIRSVALFLCLLTMVPSRGQEAKIDASKPGPQHKLLESLAGAFDARLKLYFLPGKDVVESSGVTNRAMIMDGRFLREDHDMKMAGRDMKGQALIGFDPYKKQYVSIWADSFSTSFVVLSGTYDESAKTLTLVGFDHDPLTGKKTKARDVLRIDSADQQTLQLFRQPLDGGEDKKMIEVIYTRRK